MKNRNIFTLLGVSILLFGIISMANAADWSKYDTGFDNVRVDGYGGQPGYIAFTNGSGTIVGYLYMSTDNKLYFVTDGAITLSTTQLGSQGGEQKVSGQ